MTDLSTIKTTDRTLDILHPVTKAPIGLRIRLVSMDDDRMTKAKRAITDRRLHLEARGKTFKSEEIEENATNLLFTATLDWEWYNPTGKPGDDGYDADAMPNFHDEQPEFNRKNFQALITELRWIRDQINEAMNETEAFFGNSKLN